MVLIGSCDACLRRRWKGALSRSLPTQEVADWSALEQSIASHKPATLLLDLMLTKPGGTGSVSKLQQLSPTTKIVLLTHVLDEQEGIAALKAGARGYCRADIDPSLLNKAVEMVQQGDIWVGRSVIPHLLEELTALTAQRQQGASATEDSRLDRLTPRKRGIAHLVGGGASNKEIASQLNITEATVKAHITGIFRKLEVSDRLRLALFVSEYNRASR